MFAVIGSLVMISNHYTLNGIKSRTVGGSMELHGLQRKRKYGKRMLMYHMNRSNGEQESIYQKSRGW